MFTAGLGGARPVGYDPQSRCLYVVGVQQERHLVVWPRGSRPVIEDGKRGVRVRGVGVILEGDSVTEASVAGGEIFGPDAFLPDVVTALQELDSCLPDSGKYTIFYEIGEVSRPWAPISADREGGPGVRTSSCTYRRWDDNKCTIIETRRVELLAAPGERPGRRRLTEEGPPVGAFS